MKMRNAARAGAAALAIALVAGAPSAIAGGKTVEVGDDFFSPKTLSISKGTKVAFKWVGKDEHNIIKKSGPGGDFSSPVTDERGVQFRHKFKKAGTYRLICTIHEEMKMKVNVG